MSNNLVTLSSQLATKFGMADGSDVLTALKQTVFKGNVSDAQMTALLVIANQYGLNPWCREIYAYPDTRNGIVPVVGVDGWSRIINGHPQFDGVDFEQDEAQCTAIIYRKDRSHPTKVTEYMSECRRDMPPWKSHPMRMLRHKALIQCARLAFGFTGIYDEDEAERIVEKDITPVAAVSEVMKSTPRAVIDQMSDEEREFLVGVANEIKIPLAQGESVAACELYEHHKAKLDADEQVALWALFDAPQRREIKKGGEFLKQQKADQT